MELWIHKSLVNMSKTRNSDAKPSFEQALGRIEEIVDRLEEGKSSLEESIKLYEEGMMLAKSCAAQLNEAKLKLKKIQKNAAGGFEESDLKE